MSPAAEPARAGRARLLAAGGGLLLTTVFWGSAVPFNLVLLRELDPFVLTAARMALSVAILAAFVAWREQGPLLVLPTSWLRFALLGLYMAGFNVFYTLSVLWSNPVTISAITVAMPLIGALTARIMLGTRLEKGFHTALALSIIGGALVVYGQPRFDAGALGLRGGEILMLVAMVSWNVYSLKAQAWLAQVGQARLTLVSSVSTCLWLLAVMGLMLALGVADAPQRLPGLETVAMVVYLALFGAAVGNILWNFGVSVVGLPISALYINLTAVFAVLILIGFGVEPTWLQLLGGLVVLAGVLYMQLARLRAAPA